MTLTRSPETITEDEVATPRRPWRRRLGVAAAVLVGVAIVGWLVLRWLTPHPYSGTVMQAPTAAPSMDGLVWDDGSPVDVDALGGDLVLVYFGYTACPDVCPTTLSSVDRALDRLGEDVDRVRVLMVSIDPERDDPGKVGQYVRSFDPSFRGVSGSLDAVERVASTYGIYFAQDEPLAGGGYTMSHTSTLLGIDPRGHLRIVWPSVLDPDLLADDIAELL
jgi:protein SCO1/2